LVDLSYCDWSEEALAKLLKKHYHLISNELRDKEVIQKYMKLIVKGEKRISFPHKRLFNLVVMEARSTSVYDKNNLILTASYSANNLLGFFHTHPSGGSGRHISEADLSQSLTHNIFVVSRYNDKVIEVYLLKNGEIRFVRKIRKT